MSERLQKYLAKAGLGSRRACEKLIHDKKVLINGRVASIGVSVSETDIVEYDGKIINVIDNDLKVIILSLIHI